MEKEWKEFTREVLSYFSGKTKDVIKECVNILNKQEGEYICKATALLRIARAFDVFYVPLNANTLTIEAITILSDFNDGDHKAAIIAQLCDIYCSLAYKILDNELKEYSLQTLERYKRVYKNTETFRYLYSIVEALVTTHFKEDDKTEESDEIKLFNHFIINYNSQIWHQHLFIKAEYNCSPLLVV